MYRIKDNLILRQICNRYMVVDVADAANLTNVFTLNTTAAWLWRYAEGREFSNENLAEALCKNFEVDYATAKSDVDEMLSQWKEYGLI